MVCPLSYLASILEERSRRGRKASRARLMSRALSFRRSRHCTLSTQLLLSPQVLREFHDLGQGYLVKINEGTLTMPQAGHSSHLALGPQPFKGLLIPSLTPRVSQQAHSWLWFPEFSPCTFHQMSVKGQEQSREVGRRL